MTRSPKASALFSFFPDRRCATEEGARFQARVSSLGSNPRVSFFEKRWWKEARNRYANLSQARTNAAQLSDTRDSAESPHATEEGEEEEEEDAARF